MATELAKTEAAKTESFVRIAPTTLYHASVCYSNPCPVLDSDQCRLCPVRKQCEVGQPAEIWERKSQ